MQKYVPDMYGKSIFDLPYEELRQKGITHLLFDLDNTIVSAHLNEASNEVKVLFASLQKKGFTVIIFSNSPKKRVQPFGQFLQTEIHPSSKKPLQIGFRRIFRKYKVEKESVAIIGDQLFTDIAGGNKAGVFTILIAPISKKDMFFTRFNRKREEKMFKKLAAKSLFVKERD